MTAPQGRLVRSKSNATARPQHTTNQRRAANTIHTHGMSAAHASSFNIYARPFIPKAFTIINTLPGRSIATFVKKEINYDRYITASLGPAAGFLPAPCAAPPAPGTETPRIMGLGPRHYEVFFQHHLRLESEAEARQIEACSLYGHDVVIQPASASLESGQTLCILQVPGLRENSPFVEQEDIVQLRQLRYASDGNLVGMEEWLWRLDATGNNVLDPRQGPAPGWTNIVYFARVLSVQRASETLLLRVLGLPGSPMERSEKFNVQFQLPLERHLPMRYALPEAQQALTHGGWMNAMLFPTNQDCEIQEKLHAGVFGQEFFDRDLNWEQKKAVECIWSRGHGALPYLISGPPGTGKTKTIIEATLQLVKGSADYNHVLLCAPSDPAADTLCQRLVGHLSPAQLLRLNRPCRTFAEVPDALLPFCHVQKDEFALPPFAELMGYRVVVTTCRDASILIRARMTNKDLYTVQQRMYEVFGAMNPLQNHSNPRLHWSALLIDEAAQAMEPEALIPLSIVAPPTDCPRFPGNRPPLVVMAGDEHQLGPRTCLSTSALGESLFARLFRRPVYADHPLARGKKGEAPRPLTQSLLPVFRPAFANLIRNYRSHPAILAVPSNLFYHDSLEPEATDTDRLAQWEGWQGWQGCRWPVLFHDNPSLDELELPGLMEGTGGWYNPGEASIACSYAQSLVRSGLVEQKEVCIMSPFQAQVRHLRQCMRQPAYGRLWDVDIGPTEAFQGLERGVVILCVTRARSRFLQEDKRLGWGILGMPNKMNVALTRAKYGLIVLGKRALLEEDPDWKVFVDFCDRNGLVAGPCTTNSANRRKVSANSSRQDHLTRLEKGLLDRERNVHMPPGRLWGMVSGYEPCHEMWAGGMMETPHDEDYHNV